MDTVRIARDLGDMSLLLPRGISHLMDLPYNIFIAVRQALAFLSFEELPTDEQPPREIWLEADEMAKHWKAVKAMRAKKYGTEDDDSSWSDAPLDGPEEQNAAVKEIFG